jgi:hypothetical protein
MLTSQGACNQQGEDDGLSEKDSLSELHLVFCVCDERSDFCDRNDRNVKRWTFAMFAGVEESVVFKADGGGTPRTVLP